jgi:NDP-sugar pyrophosphorylase family protein
MTILLTNNVKDPNDRLGIDYFIGFDSKNLITYFNTSSELKNELKLNKNFIKNCSHMTLTTKYFAPYLFIFSKESLNILVKKEFSSITSEFIPYISKLNGKRVHPYFTECFAKRCYTLTSFQNISKQVSKEVELLNFYPLEERIEYDNCNIGPDCIVGSSFVCGEENVVKKNSIIGSNCTFGSNVKIVNSIIMSKVVIGDKCFIFFKIQSCTITSSLIASGTKIKEKTNLSGTTIGPNEEIATGEYKNEIICLHENKIH